LLSRLCRQGQGQGQPQNSEVYQVSKMYRAKTKIKATVKTIRAEAEDFQKSEAESNASANAKIVKAKPRTLKARKASEDQTVDVQNDFSRHIRR